MKADSARNNEVDAEDDDLDKFSDINSQEDDDPTRERKENNGMRKGMKTFASNLMTKATSMIQTPVSAFTALGRANTTPFTEEAAFEAKEEKKDIKSSNGVTKGDGDEKMSEDEKRRIMRMIEQEDSSDDEDGSDEDDKSLG